MNLAKGTKGGFDHVRPARGGGIKKEGNQTLQKRRGEHRTTKNSDFFGV